MPTHKSGVPESWWVCPICVAATPPMVTPVRFWPLAIEIATTTMRSAAATPMLAEKDWLKLPVAVPAPDETNVTDAAMPRSHPEVRTRSPVLNRI